MPMSPYVQSLRSRIGHDLLLLPGVTAVIRDAERFLLARHRATGLWSMIGGGVEPGEAPEAALSREVLEELGVTPLVGRIIGAYGGGPLETTLPNGDRVGYVTVAYECTLPSSPLTLEADELLETGWFALDEVRSLRRHAWVDAVLADCTR